MRSVTGAAILALALAACASAAGGGRASEASSAADPAQGERLYRAHCGACHRLREPSELTARDWARFVPHYGPRAHLDPSQQAAVLAYLQGKARP